MILEDILNTFEWTPYGINCPDYITMRTAHKFLREAILDRHMYVCKVIGFDISTSAMSRGHAGTYIARHRQLCESYPEVMLHLQDKLFMTTSNADLRVTLNAGENTIGNVEFLNDKREPVRPLYLDEEVCRVIDKTCTLRLKVVYDCGYRSCQQNSKKLGSDYFPCFTDFYTGDFFRVLPPEPSGNTINVKYYNGATKEDLRLLLTNWLNAIVSGGIRKEERVWLRSFMQ